MRQLDVEAARGAEDRLARADVDLVAVDEERVGLLSAFVMRAHGASRHQVSQRFRQFLGEIFQHAEQRIRRRLAEAADRGVAHRGRQLGQQRRVPRALRHQLDGLLGADAAGRALAAAFVLEELHQVERHRLHVVLVGQDDNRVRADEAAVFFQRAEIERQVGHRRRQDAAGGAARQIALEGVAVGHAAAIFVDQFARGDAGRRQHHARLLHAAGDREAAEALALAAALRGQPVRRPSRRCRAPRTASRRSAPASAGRTGRPARRRAGGGAAARACPRSIRSSPTLRRRCRRRRRGADAAWCAATRPALLDLGDLLAPASAALRDIRRGCR